MTGVEGYVESAASGLIAGINVAHKVENKGRVIFLEKRCWVAWLIILLMRKMKKLPADECQFRFATGFR